MGQVVTHLARRSGGSLGSVGGMRAASSAAVEVSPGALGEALRGLRLGGEDAVSRMAESLARYGQLTAVTVFAARPDRLEVVDGFKRLAAARRLEWQTLRVEVLDVDVVQAKAAVALLNQASALSELEEAWLVRSLYREDHLGQFEIGRLLRRHKAWVCRRLALAEGLDERVEADVRLGLLGARAAYEVTRLPRGNQLEVAELVVRRGLTVGQTAQLVTALCGAGDGAEREALLREAAEGNGLAPPRSVRRERSPTEVLLGDIGGLTRIASRLQARLLEAPLCALGAEAAEQVGRALAALEPVLLSLAKTVRDRGGSGAELA